MKEKPVVIDLFAGAGGESQGIHWAMGDDVKLFAVNHWAIACETHAKNFPEDECICQDITTVIPTSIVPNRKVALMWASPECFPAGTLVLTDKGYMPIETIKEGDTVLTHKGRWRKVTSVMQSEKEVVEVKGYGHYGLTATEAHPFYIGSRKEIYHHRDREVRFSEPKFMALKDVEKLAGEKNTTVYWSRPANVDGLEIPQIPVVNGRSFDINPDMMWLAGRYVADGYTRVDDRKGEISISCGDDKVGKAMRRLSVWKRKGDRSGANEMVWHPHITRTAVNLTTDAKGVATWLGENFGRLAYGKKIPSWLYGAEEELRWSFIEGYLSGDGSMHDGVISCTTVSRELAIGLATLLGTVGVSVQMQKPKLRAEQYIEGRKVNCRQQYSLKWKAEIAKGHSQTPAIDDSHLWSAIKGFNHLEGTRKVYNLSVEEDESYVAEGICVHNCTHFSSARGGKPCDAQSRCTPWDILRWATMLDIDRVIVENVKEFLSWGPLDENNRPIPELKGVYFNSWFTAMSKLGYKSDWRILNAANYGAPTTRSRLFVQFSRKTIVWPEATYSAEPDLLNGGQKRWIPAREVIDFSVPQQSILNRKTPLKPATMEKISNGIKRFWGADKCEPFLARYNGGANRVHSLNEPVPTLDCSNRYALVEPIVFGYYGNATFTPVSKPMPTVPCAQVLGLLEAVGKKDKVVDVSLRMLTVEELKKAQSFPPSYEFTGTHGDQVKQIGNAVCPKMAEALVGA